MAIVIATKKNSGQAESGRAYLPPLQLRKASQRMSHLS